MHLVIMDIAHLMKDPIFSTNIEFSLQMALHCSPMPACVVGILSAKGCIALVIVVLYIDTMLLYFNLYICI